ncbi:MAG: tetratricopeptide repeat protein [bacterium]
MISQEELKILKSFAERIPEGDPGAHNNLAIVYYNKGLYDEAIEELEQALKIDSNFVLARNNLDIILRKTGRLEEKIERLVRIIDREPYDETKTLELADTYRKLNRYSQAIIFYRKVLDFNPGSFEAHYGLGITLKLLGKYDDALEEIKTALEIKISPDVYRTLGEIYFNKGIIDLAIRNFQESIMLDPSLAEGHFLLGFALGEKGKIDESLEEVKKAIALNPALAQFEPNLPIDIKEHKGHWEFLKDQLGTPKISDNDYQVHYNLGMTYRNKGLFNEAKREFEECYKLQPDNPDLQLVFGEVELFLGRLDSAQKYVQKAYESDFDSAACINVLGVVHCLRGELNAAVKIFSKALAIENNHSAVLNNMAVIQSNLNNQDKALGYYQKAISGGCAEARFNIGMHYLRSGEHDKALNSFSGVTADEEFGKGLVYYEKGRDDDAIASFKKTLSTMPNHAGAYYNIGFIYTKLGKFKEGLDNIKKGMEIEPNYDKDKYLIALEPELSGYGLYYSQRINQVEKTKMIEKDLPVLEIPSADNYIANAEVYLKNNSFEDALSMVDQALGLQPEWSKAIILKTDILSRMTKTEDAIAVLEQYIGEYPQDVEVKAALGSMMRQNNRLEEAEKIYLELLDTDETNIEWLTQEAEILTALGRLDDALQYYDKIYDLDNENIAANLGFSRIHISKRDFEKAEPYLNFLNDKHTDIYDYNVLAGLYFHEKNEHDEAVHHFEKAIELDSSRALPYYQLGLLSVQKGDFERACDNWKKALLLSPDEEIAKKTRQCLKMTVELSEFIKQQA